MNSVLWTCIVYEEDAKWLPSHLAEVLRQELPPRNVVVIDTDNSELIRSVVECSGRWHSAKIEYVPLGENLGFNPGLNKAISLAIQRDTEWLAVMTVRAKPDKHWLLKAIEAGGEDKIGMVTTLHLAPDGVIDCLGHNVGPNGELLDFGQGLTRQQLFEISPSTETLPVWAPCSGGALYRTKALDLVIERAPERCLLRPLGFKSYNCDVLGYFLRSTGYKNASTLDAFCIRDRSGSSSRRPNTPGLLMNQEINRVANMFEFWQQPSRDTALRRYLEKDRSKAGLQPLDLRIARTLGQALARTDLCKSIGKTIEKELSNHIKSYHRIREVRDKYLGKG